jgi:hypothetical protein
LPGTNTLAYLALSSKTKEKRFFQHGRQMNSTLVGFSAKPFYRVVTVVVNDSNIYKEIILLDEREG